MKKKKIKKKILVTGGAGFIGSYLTEELLKRGEEVFVLDDLSTGRWENISHLEKEKNFHFIEGSILEEKTVEKLVKKVDEIYHLAAAVGVKKIMENPLQSFLINIKGTEIIFEKASKKKIPVLFSSSSEVYGKNEKVPFKEDSDRCYGSAYNIRWGYGLSKSCDEYLGLCYFREKKLPVVIVRFFNIIGPRQSSAYGMVVPRFVKQALKGQPLTVYGDGYQTRCFANVKDIIPSLIKLMEHPHSKGEIFNLGSDEEVTIKELAQKIKSLTASPSKIVFIPYEKVYGRYFEDMIHRKPDLSKVKNLIGYEPKISLEESLKEIIKFYEERKDLLSFD